MVNIPTSLCSPCQTQYPTDGINYIIPDFEECVCPTEPNPVLKEIINTSLCPCPPVPPAFKPYIPVPKEEVEVFSCFPELIKNIVTTKFCKLRPKCR